MRVYWLNTGLHFEAETQEDIQRLAALQAMFETGVEIGQKETGPGYSYPEKVGIGNPGSPISPG